MAPATLDVELLTDCEMTRTQADSHLVFPLFQPENPWPFRPEGVSLNNPGQSETTKSYSARPGIAANLREPRPERAPLRVIQNVSPFQG